MPEASKAAKKHFRKLAAVAHERELSKALEALSAQFERWRTGELDAFDLNEEIHMHHQGIARDLYTLYVHGEPSYLVAHALVSGCSMKKRSTSAICRS